MNNIYSPLFSYGRDIGYIKNPNAEKKAYKKRCMI